MNWLDIVIIVIAAIRAYIGWNQGFVRAIISIAGLIVGILLAGQFADNLAEWMGGAQWAYFVAFAIILIIVLLIADIIGGILKKITKLAMLGWLDSLAGMVLGFLIGALVVAAILASSGAWAHLLSEHEIIESAKQGMSKAISDSTLAELLIDKFRLVLGLLPEKFDSIVEFFD